MAINQATHLQGTVTAPSWGIETDQTIMVPDASTYDQDDVMVFANRTIMIAAQAAARGAAESAGNKALKAGASKADAEKAAQSAMGDWLRNKAPSFKVERRDEEASAAKKVAKTIDTAKALGKDDAAKLLAALLAANPELAATVKAKKAA